MNKKKLLCFCLALAALFSLVSCAAAPETPSLQGKSDAETVAELLAGYKGLDLPAVSYEMVARYDVAGEKISSTASVSVVGDHCSVDSETVAEGVSVPYGFVYVDGILYVNALGVRVKGAATAEDADKAFGQQVPFLLKDTELFATRTLLRSEQGDYQVVLSDPKSDMTSLLNLSSVLKAGEGEEAPRLLRTSDFYVTLGFSAQGALQKVTVGGDVTFLSGGVEALLTFEVKFTDIKTEGVTVSVPSDAEEYTEAEPEVPSTEGTEDSDASDDAA